MMHAPRLGSTRNRANLCVSGDPAGPMEDALSRSINAWALAATIGFEIS